MKARLEKFLRVLRVELEDLEEDLNDLVVLTQERMDRRQITNYVYQENTGLLLNELSCLRDVLATLAEVDTARFTSAEAMIDEVQRTILERARKCAFPEVVASLVTRKIEKVRRYVTSAD